VRRFVFIFLWLCCSLNVFASQCVVTGVVKNADGKTLLLKTQKDGILMRDSVLAVSVVQNDTFRFEFQLNETRCLFVDLGTNIAQFYVEPNEKIEIQVPNFQPLNEAQKRNPFFQPLQVSPHFKQPNITEKIVDFDEAFDFYYSKNAFSPDTNHINLYLRQLDSIFPKTENQFFEQYKAFQKIQLVNLYQKTSPDVAVSKLKKLPMAFENPAFWETFNTVFNAFFTSFTGEEQQYIDRAIFEQNYEAMDAILQFRFEIDDKNFRELIVVKSLYDLYFSNERSAFVFKLMNLWLPKIESNFCHQLLQDMIDLTKKVQIGENAYDFSLPNEKGETIKLSSFLGKYVLLNFCDTKITLANKNLSILKRFAELYGKDLVVLNIFTEELTEAQKSNLNKVFVSKKGNVKMLFAEKDILLSYDVKNLPTYYLLDRKNRFLLTDFLLEERFEELFVDILRKGEIEKSKLPKEGVDEWWK